MSPVEALAPGFGQTRFEAVMDADQAVLDALPTAICVCAADGVLLRFNRRAAELWGRTPQIGGLEERFCGAWRLYDLAGKSAGSPTEKALHTGQPQRDQEVMIERPDGTRMPVRVNVEILRDVSGAICGAVSSLEEITRGGTGLDKAALNALGILEALPAAVYTTDAEGRITFYNRAAAELAGHEPELGKDKWCVTWRLRRPDGTVLPHDECPMAVALKEQRPVRGIEAFAERPDGTRVPFMPYPTPMFGPSGELVGAVNMLVDISERKRTEAVLRTQSERLDALNGIAKILSKDFDLKRIVQAVTDSATRLSGAKFGAFFYKLIDDKGERFQLYTLSGAPDEAFEGIGLPRNMELFEPTFRGEGVVRSDDVRRDPRCGRKGLHFDMPAGHMPVVSYLAVPVVSRTGEIHGGLFFGHDQPGVFTADSEEIVSALAAHAAIAIDNADAMQELQRDVERRDKAERAAQQLAAIVESSEDAIVSKNLDAVIQTWNVGAERVFGYTADEVIGKSITILIPEGHESEEPEILRRIRRGERVEHYETKRRRKDGSIIDVSLTISPVRNAEGRIVGASKIARDISERKRSEAALARRMREQAALYRLTDRLHRATSLPEIYDAGLDAIVEALACDRASILLFDEKDVMRFVAWRGLSAGYRKAVDGHTPWQRGERNPQPIVVEDVAEADLPDELKSVVSQEGIGALGFIPMATGGRLIGKFMTYYSAPHAFSDAETDLALAIARQIGFSVERIRGEAARRAAEEQSRESEKRLQMAMAAGRMGAWEWDIASGRVIWSPGLETLHGLEPGTFGGSFDDYKRDIHPDDVADVEARIEQALHREEDYEVAYRIRRPDGAVRWMQAYGRVTRLPDGKPMRMAGVCMDVTERKEAETQRNLLVAELSHRVKNTLATVISVARQSFSTNPDAQAAQRSFNARIRALGQTHSRIAEANWSGVPLETLLRDETAPYLDETGTNVRLSGPPAMLNPKYALTLGMAVHELVTNAAKYGALSAKEGVVEIGWRFVGEDLHISWSERGGPPVTAPARAGFGRRLVERVLASDLGGKVSMDFAPEGLTCLIVLPPRQSAGEGAIFPPGMAK